MEKKHTDPFDFENLETKYVILNCALIIEEHITKFLRSAFSMSKSSSTLGYGSKRLSFDTMIDLLVDLEYFDKSEREAFRLFASIRNKFLHVRECETFTQLFDLYLKGEKSKFERIAARPLLHEAIYQLGFVKLHTQLVESVLKMQEKRLLVLRTQREISETIIEKYNFEKSIIDSLKLLINHLETELCKLDATEELRELLAELARTLDEEYFTKNYWNKYVELIQKIKKIKYL